MFGIKKSNKKIVEKMVEPIKLGSSIEEEVETYVLEEHKKLTSKLGMVDTSNIQEESNKLTKRKQELLQFFINEDIKVYNLEKVKKFLNNLYGVSTTGSDNPGWNWVKLFEQKVIIIEAPWIFAKGTSSGGIASGLYDKEIPLRTLYLIEKVKENFPNLCFFASAMDIRKPDPFLMVTFDGTDLWVIDHWDEPTFKD